MSPSVFIKFLYSYCNHNITIVVEGPLLNTDPDPFGRGDFEIWSIGFVGNLWWLLIVWVLSFTLPKNGISEHVGTNEVGLGKRLTSAAIIIFITGCVWRLMGKVLVRLRHIVPLLEFQCHELEIRDMASNSFCRGALEAQALSVSHY